MSWLWIPGRLPGLNEIIDAKSKRQRRGKVVYSAYDAMKRELTGKVALLARSQGVYVSGADRGACFTYLFIEPDRRRDPSNFVAGGIKIIEDGLQTAGIIENDGWKQVEQFYAFWTIGKPGVLLLVNRNGSDRYFMMREAAERGLVEI